MPLSSLQKGRPTVSCYESVGDKTPSKKSSVAAIGDRGWQIIAIKPDSGLNHEKLIVVSIGNTLWGVWMGRYYERLQNGPSMY